MAKTIANFRKIYKEKGRRCVAGHVIKTEHLSQQWEPRVLHYADKNQHVQQHCVASWPPVIHRNHSYSVDSSPHWSSRFNATSTPSSTMVVPIVQETFGWSDHQSSSFFSRVRSSRKGAKDFNSFLFSGGNCMVLSSMSCVASLVDDYYKNSSTLSNKVNVERGAVLTSVPV